MKSKINLAIIFIATFALMACSPESDFEFSENTLTSPSDFTLVMTPSSGNEFEYNYEVVFGANVSTAYSIVIHFGDGGTTRALSGTHEYVVFAGTYTAQCIITTPYGNTIITEQEIVFTKDNEKAYGDDEDSFLFALTGGKDNVNGKKWYIGPWTAMRNPGNRGEVWWDFKNDALMNDNFTFKPNGLQPNGAFVYVNNGDTHMNEELGHLFPDGNPDGSFVTEHYTPPADATWKITARDGKQYLTITKGFLGYAASPDELNESEYEVVSFSATTIRLYNSSTWDGWAWELTVEEPVIVPVVPKELEEVPMFEDFEGDLSINFVFEDMGPFASAKYSNPAPVPINASKFVFLYQKTNAFYSNISFVAPHLFDLTEQNIIKMKVFIPGYNDFETEGDVAGNWISNRKLRPRVAVKLQNSLRGGNAWETETVRFHDDVETDKWVELVFDFSAVAARIDYDKIVIQFGDEGHTRPGIFFFDDFSFDKE